MKMAVFNVIRNAFQAMRNGGELTVSTRLDGDDVRVAFEDTGGGIPAERMGRVFEAYHTSKPEGTGLGLLVVRQILHKHGGEVDLVSRQGLGLEVSFRLPLHVRQVRQLAYGPATRDSGPRETGMPVIDVEARPVETREGELP
jgi:signal transduction histidine kinase